MAQRSVFHGTTVNIIFDDNVTEKEKCAKALSSLAKIAKNLEKGYEKPLL